MKAYRFLLVVVMVALHAGAPARAQLQTGDLYGKVTDGQAQVLPGVTVTVTGTGAERAQITDATGAFRFLGMYPGSYRVKAELQGFNTMEFPSIGVHVGAKTELTITMNQALKEEITVTGEAPLLDERQTNRGTTLAAKELDQVPTARDPWSLLALTPGVQTDRINIGGNESGQQSDFVGVGSIGRDNVFAVDGVVMTDMNSVGASATYFDFGAFEEVQLTVSSTDVDIATAGVTINQVTKRGTNDWRGQARYLDTSGSWQAKPAQLSPGVSGNRIDSVKEYGADLGGPIWKDHLWGWGSWGVSDIRDIAGGGQLDQTKLKDWNWKLNFQLGPSDSGVLHYWTNNKLKFGRDASPTRAPETTHNQTTPSKIFKLEDTWIPNSKLYITALASRNDGAFTLAPQGGLNADIFVTPDNVRRGTWSDFGQTARIDQWRGDAHYFFNTGKASHELKFGGGFRDQEDHSATVWPHGKIVWAGNLFGFDPGTAVVGFQRNRAVGLDTRYTSGWLQDTMSLDRLTVTAGVRWDKQKGKNLASADGGNPEAPGVAPGAPPLIPPISFPGNDAGGFNWSTVVPRIGLTYALGEDRKTLLRGSFSQYAEQLGQNPLLSRVSPLGYSYAYFYFADANGNLRLDPNEIPSLQFMYATGINIANPGSLTTANVNDKNLKPMKTDELTLGVEHALRDDLGIGLTFTYRNVRDVPEERTYITDADGNVRLATRDDFVQVSTIQATLPDGSLSPAVPVYDLKPGLNATGGLLYTNGDREIKYRGVTASFDKRLSNRWSARGHYTWSDWKWSIGPKYRLYQDPTNVVADPLGYSDDQNGVFFEQSAGNKADVFVSGRWSYDLEGLYEVAPDRPWGINVGGSLTGRDGYIAPPFAKANSNQGLASRNVQLTSRVDSFRLSSVAVLNGHIDKEFSFGETRLVLAFDGFNLTNKHPVLQRDRNSGVDPAARYEPLEALSPRIFRLGATLRFH